MFRWYTRTVAYDIETPMTKRLRLAPIPPSRRLLDAIGILKGRGDEMRKELQKMRREWDKRGKKAKNACPPALLNVARFEYPYRLLCVSRVGNVCLIESVPAVILKPWQQLHKTNKMYSLSSASRNENCQKAGGKQSAYSRASGLTGLHTKKKSAGSGRNA